MIKLLSILFVVLLSVASGRVWVDRNGISIEGIVSQLNERQVAILVSSGQVQWVDRSKLSEPDQNFLNRMDANKSTAKRLRLKVFQSMPDGALCEVYITRVVTRQRQVPSSYSKLQQKQYYRTENYEVVENVKLHDLAFVDGLEIASDGDVIDVIAWGDGRYHYTTVNQAAANVPKYTLTPKEDAVPIQAFGR